MLDMSEKLNQVLQDVPKVYHAGQMTVVENAECLKGSKTDTAMLLDDVSPVEHTMGVKVHGKNLLPPADSGIYYKGSIKGGDPFIAYSSYGISDFNNLDVSSYRGVYAVIKLTEGKTYTLTVNNLINNCATKQIFLTVGFRSSESTVFGTSETSNRVTSSTYNPSSFTFTVPSGYPYCLVGFYNYPTVSGDTISFNAMQLELGTKATDYEPYNSDIQNVHSKNLIPYPYAETTKTVNGVTFTDNGDGTITVNGTTPSDSGASFMLSNIDIPIKAGIYTTSGCVSGSNSSGDNIMIMIVAQDDDYNMYDLADTGSNKTTTIVNDSHIINLSIQIPPDITLNNAVFKPQLEYGSTATAYAKYHEPYPLVISRYGKNLFDEKQITACVKTSSGEISTVMGTVTEEYLLSKHGLYSLGTHWIGYKVYLEGGKTYALSVDAYLATNDGNSRVVYIGLIKVDESDKATLVLNKGISLSANDTWERISSQFRVTESGYYCLRAQASGNSTQYKNMDTRFKNVQLELGSTATDYEPYITPTEYTPTADGTVNGVESLYPSTTLLTNDPYGKVYIDCDYYKDIDKTFNELTTSVALSGGE